jgi:hypothetical protein
MVVDPAEHIGEPGFGVDVVELRGLCRTPNYAERRGYSQHFQ